MQRSVFSHQVDGHTEQIAAAMDIAAGHKFRRLRRTAAVNRTDSGVSK